MKPTVHLRFIERYEWPYNPNTQTTEQVLSKVLQQWWEKEQPVGAFQVELGTPTHSPGEWRDVELGF